MNRICWWNIIATALWGSLLGLVLPACSPEEEPASPLDLTPYELEVPAHFPYPDIPEDNVLTEARVELGRRLFYDPILSRDRSISCASCHKQHLAFADDQPISPGIAGRLGFRNSPTLANLAWLNEVNKDGGVIRLDLQATVPLEDHAEMDFQGILAAERLKEIPLYRALSLRAYEREPSIYVIVRALAAFQRTLISGSAAYDAYLQGDEQALDPSQQRGMELFFSDRLQCGSCHGGFNLTDNSYRNNGLYEQYEDHGRFRITGDPMEMGAFRVPTLRNVALTAPYMHDGSLPDLDAVLDHYASGGSNHAAKDPLIQGFALSAQERQDLLRFLESLTDPGFLNDPDFGPPD
jgi:cytochrome c peroxidase